LLIQYVNSISRNQELSSQQMVLYIMGWGDRIKSHNVVPIFWSTAKHALCTAYIEFQSASDVSLLADGGEMSLLLSIVSHL
jgi:hypothetical protein